MDGRGSDAGTSDASADDGPARTGDDEPAAVDPPPVERDQFAGIDPWPSTGSLRWAPDDVPAVTARGDDTTEVITPDEVVPPPYRGTDETTPPGWALPPVDSRAGPDRGGEPPGPPSWGPPVGAGAPPGPGPPPAPQHLGHAPGVARVRRPEIVVLAAVAVLVVVVGLAVMALGGDGGPDASDAPATTTTVVAAGDGTDPTGPIVGPSGIVGWWSGTAWVSRADGEPPEGGVELTVVGLSGAARTAEGETVAEECAPPQAGSELDVAVDLGGDGDGPPPIAVAGVGAPQPRPVEQLGTTLPLYQQAATQVAAGLGATTPPTVTQVVRSDLDGSGTDEVVVAAEHVSDAGSPAAGNWSVVFLRRVVGNGVATDVVASSIAGADGGFDRIRVSSLADLNADGTMELVVDGRSTDGRWTSVHEVGGDGAPTEVLRDGCDG